MNMTYQYRYLIFKEFKTGKYVTFEMFIDYLRNREKNIEQHGRMDKSPLKNC